MAPPEMGEKIVGKQVSLDDGSKLYLRFVPVATEDASTLLDVTLHMFKRLPESYSVISQSDSEVILKNLLCKINSTMTDRASVMKLFGKKIEEFLRAETGIEAQVHFLNCNAHFFY